MKEIKTSRYLKKEAIYGDFPIGDPGLPENLTERDIPGSIDSNEEDRRGGETEIDVNWPKFNQWFERGGGHLPEVLKIRMMPTTVWVSYKYSYNYNENSANNIKIIKIKDYETGKIITDSHLLESLGEYFNEEIKNDIEIEEDDAKLESSPDYNLFE